MVPYVSSPTCVRVGELDIECAGDVSDRVVGGIAGVDPDIGFGLGEPRSTGRLDGDLRFVDGQPVHILVAYGFATRNQNERGHDEQHDESGH